MRRKCHRLVVFGKGGIGKSTICANLAVAYAQEGLKVLIVGCDPKHDTTLHLTGGKHIPTVLQSANFQGGSPVREDLVFPGTLGIDCVEAGGPEPGIGCAGRGITRMSELLKAAGVSDDTRYDVVLYDVLGDVVCGGFATPLREGFAEKVMIVTSEELMSLYAANNIARAVRNNAGRGNSLVGLVANLRDPGAEAVVIERFAAMLGTKVIQTIGRDPVVREAEFQKKTAIEFAPGSAIATAYRRLARTLLMPVEPGFVPAPLDDEAFHEASRTKFARAAPARTSTAVPAAPEYRPLTEPWRRFLLPLGVKPQGPPRGWEAEVLAAELAAEKLAVLHRKAGFSEAPPRQNSVNLIGLPEGKGALECGRLLEKAGLTVNAVLLPRLDAAEAKRFLSAERHVLAERPCLEAAYRRGMAPLALAETRLLAPFGWVGTRDWLCAVAALHGFGTAARKVWEAEENALLPSWREQRARVKGRRVAFVTEPGEASSLTDGSNPSGLPLLPILREMGFAVDLLLYAPCLTVPKSSPTVRVIPFESQGQFERLLRDGDFETVYSDFPLDERIAAAGKAQLSLHAFEPGIQGALRTIKRLASGAPRPSSSGPRSD